MRYELAFLDEALKEWRRLDASARDPRLGSLSACVIRRSLRPGCTARTDAVPALSDVVVLAVPFKAVFGFRPGLLSGRLAIDTNDDDPDRDDRIDELEERRNTTSQMVADHFPDATVVKAFNAILAKDPRNSVVMPHGVRRALPVAGDDACDRVAALHTDFGCEAVDAGPLSESWRFERAKPAYRIPLDRDRLNAALAAADRNVDLPDGSWRR